MCRDFTVSDSRVVNEWLIGKIWKETVVAYLKIFFRHLPGRTEDSIEKFPSNR